MRDPSWNRREFVHVSTGVAFAIVAPKGWHRCGRPQHHAHDFVSPMMLRDPGVKALALSAIDAAHRAGARYADVRLTYTTSTSGPTVTLGLSMRALVEGYWGWATRPDLTKDAGPWVGREAVRLAKQNAVSGQPRRVDLGTIPVVQDGVWTTPIQIDPFAIAEEEQLDWLAGLRGYIEDLGASRGDRHTSATAAAGFTKQERVFASTEGSYLNQTVYITKQDISFSYRDIQGNIRLPGEAQAGWEYVVHQPWEELIRQEMDRIDEEIAHYGKLPHRPLPIDRYDIVCPAGLMAQLLNETLGYATELDRALMYEAEASGTSYLGPDPLTYLGTPIASPFVTVTADRSTPQGLATIQWDDDGVTPEDFTLVKDGVLVDYQTTREQAAWLAPWYLRHGKPIRSHGCAAASDALNPSMQHQPNLTLQPGKEDLGLEDLVAGLEHGLVITDHANVGMDFQHLNGVIFKDSSGFHAFEVRRGKRVARVGLGMQMMFRAPELWKGLIAIGGPKSVERGFTGDSVKGEEGLFGGESGVTNYSIAAVPAAIRQVAVVNLPRTR